MKLYLLSSRCNQISLRCYCISHLMKLTSVSGLCRVKRYVVCTMIAALQFTTNFRRFWKWRRNDYVPYPQLLFRFSSKRSSRYIAKWRGNAEITRCLLPRTLGLPWIWGAMTRPAQQCSSAINDLDAACRASLLCCGRFFGEPILPWHTFSTCCPHQKRFLVMK